MKHGAALGSALVVGISLVAYAYVKSLQGVGILHHVRTQGFDFAAILGICVGLGVGILYLLGRRLERKKDP